MSERETIATYLEGRASSLRQRAQRDHDSTAYGEAARLEAIASDIRAGLHMQDGVE